MGSEVKSNNLEMKNLIQFDRVYMFHVLQCENLELFVLKEVDFFKNFIFVYLKNQSQWDFGGIFKISSPSNTDILWIWLILLKNLHLPLKFHFNKISLLVYEIHKTWVTQVKLLKKFTVFGTKIFSLIEPTTISDELSQCTQITLIRVVGYR